VEVTVTTAERHYGGRIMISVSKRGMEVMDALVGMGKRFKRKSDLIDYAIKECFGSVKQKTEDRRLELLSELETLITDLRKLKAKEDNVACITVARFLANYYQMSLNLDLVDRAQGEWDEHWNEDVGYAVWTDAKGEKVRIALKDGVLRAIVVAMKADELNRKIERLRTELRRSSGFQEGSQSKYPTELRNSSLS